MIAGNKQSIFDLAIQSAGSVMAAVALASANNMLLTTYPGEGAELTETGVVENREVYQYFKDRNLTPATWSANLWYDYTIPPPYPGGEDEDGEAKGIGEAEIGNTLIVL